MTNPKEKEESGVREFIVSIREHISLYPKGSHFCITTKQPGFPLCADNLHILLDSYDSLQKKLDRAMRMFSPLRGKIASQRDSGHIDRLVASMLIDFINECERELKQ